MKIRKPVSVILIIFGIILIVWGLSIGWGSTFGSPKSNAMAKRVVPGGYLLAAGLIGITLKRNENVSRLPHP